MAVYGTLTAVVIKMWSRNTHLTSTPTSAPTSTKYFWVNLFCL